MDDNKPSQYTLMERKIVALQNIIKNVASIEADYKNGFDPVVTMADLEELLSSEACKDAMKPMRMR